MDGYDVMQVCRRGHIITRYAATQPEHRQDYCDKCGAETLDACPKCNVPIRGEYHSDVLVISGPGIPALFSPQAIQQGAFDKYASKKRTRGTASVDDVFLDQLEAWRQDLAKHLLRQNQHLTQRPLNHAVQLIIDRIVFLRICEDRGSAPLY